MRVALDTNRYVAFAKGDPETQAVLKRANQIFLPLIVMAELRAGFQAGSRSADNERNLTQFINSPRVTIVYPDDDTTHHYARLYAQLRRQGTPIPANDIWIAALVIQHELYLFARDRHFNHIPQIPVI
jgi:tRNA(fMet)-specific endonuclease VapC